MRILVVEDHVGDSTDAILDIVEAGHRVVRCQPIGGHVDPCAGLHGAVCPLSEPVDAVVDFRTGDEFEIRELGAICAARLGVPVVSVGHHEPPFATVHTTVQDLVGTLESLR